MTGYANDIPLDDLYIDHKNRVRLECTHHFRHGHCWCSVYGWHAGYTLQQRYRGGMGDRVVLARITLDSKTPKEQVRETLQNMLEIVLQRLGTQDYVLRTKVRV